MTIHPVAELFPMLSDAELDALAADIKAHGQQQPIVCQGDVLLDGRNRLAACRLAGVAPVMQQYAGADPVAFIIGANLHRRHLSESQRAAIAAKLANLREGRPQKTAQICAVTPVSQTDAAKLLNVSRRSVQAAARVQREAAPEVVAAVAAGTMTVHAAEKTITAKPQEVKTDPTMPVRTRQSRAEDGIPAPLAGALHSVECELRVCAAKNWRRCDRQKIAAAINKIAEGVSDENE